MAGLKETDEPVEKAGMLPKRGSARSAEHMDRRAGAHYRNNGLKWLARRAIGQRKRADDGFSRGMDRGGRILDSVKYLARRSVRKSTDPLATLYTEIEKARGKGLIRGGSSRLASKLMRAGQKGIGIKRNLKLDRVMSKIGERNYRGKIPGTNRFRSANPGAYK